MYAGTSVEEAPHPLHREKGTHTQRTTLRLLTHALRRRVGPDILHHHTTPDNSRRDKRHHWHQERRPVDEQKG